MGEKTITSPCPKQPIIDQQKMPDNNNTHSPTDTVTNSMNNMNFNPPSRHINNCQFDNSTVTGGKPVSDLSGLGVPLDSPTDANDIDVTEKPGIRQAHPVSSPGAQSDGNMSNDSNQVSNIDSVNSYGITNSLSSVSLNGGDNMSLSAQGSPLDSLASPNTSSSPYDAALAYLSHLEHRLARLESEQEQRSRRRKMNLIFSIVLLSMSTHIMIRNERIRVGIQDISYGLLRCCSDKLAPDSRFFGRQNELLAMVSFVYVVITNAMDSTYILMQDYVFHYIFEVIGVPSSIAIFMVIWFFLIPLLFSKQKRRKRYFSQNAETNTTSSTNMEDLDLILDEEPSADLRAQLYEKDFNYADSRGRLSLGRSESRGFYIKKRVTENSGSSSSAGVSEYRNRSVGAGNRSSKSLGGHGRNYSGRNQQRVYQQHMDNSNHNVSHSVTSTNHQFEQQYPDSVELESDLNSGHGVNMELRDSVFQNQYVNMQSHIDNQLKVDSEGLLIKVQDSLSTTVNSNTAVESSLNSNLNTNSNIVNEPSLGLGISSNTLQESDEGGQSSSCSISSADLNSYSHTNGSGGAEPGAFLDFSMTNTAVKTETNNNINELLDPNINVDDINDTLFTKTNYGSAATDSANPAPDSLQVQV